MIRTGFSPYVTPPGFGPKVNVRTFGNESSDNKLVTGSYQQLVAAAQGLRDVTNALRANTEVKVKAVEKEPTDLDNSQDGTPRSANS